MRYPRPQSPGIDDTVVPVTKNAAGEQSRDGDLATAKPEGSNQNEDRHDLVVERRLRTGLMALQRVVASYEAGEPLPRGLGGVDDVVVSTCRGNDRDRDESQPSRGLEIDREKLEANTKLEASGHTTRETPSTPGGPQAVAVVTDTTPPPRINGNPDTEAGQESETPTTSISQSTIPASSRSPQESRSSSGSTGGSKTLSSSNEGNYSADAAKSGRSEHDGTLSNLSKLENGLALTSNDEEQNISSRSQVSGHTDRSNDAERAPTTEIPDVDAGKPSSGGNRESLHTLPILREREGLLVRAVDLENGAQEARRLASVAAATCKDFNEKEAALLR